MSEVITETILPGTYIEVRAAGLLTVGAIATGNVGVIGTAEKGDTEFQILSGYEDARAKFGEPGDWDPNSSDNLSLVRALKFVFDNGALTVYARRVYETDPTKTPATPATFQLTNASNAPVLSLQAKTPGTWGNRLQLKIEPADAQALVPNELLTPRNGALILSAAELLVPQQSTGAAPPNTGVSVGSVSVTEHGLTKKFQLRTLPGDGVVQVDTTTRALTFPTAPPSDAEIEASYWVKQGSLRKITFFYGNQQEVYVVPSLSYLAQLLTDPNQPSALVDVVQLTGDGLPNTATTAQNFTKGLNGSVSLGNYMDALDDMVTQDVQIVAPVGKPFAEIKGSILGHVEITENLGRERIAILGGDKDDVTKILEDANAVADKRVVLVAPGLDQFDPGSGQIIKLPAYYTAAAVAGKLSSLSPPTSLTNKTLASIDGLSANYNYGELKSLVQNRVLALEDKRGIRVVKGISTDDQAFQQISIRRIVDYIKEGTRQGANQYIGLLNNRAVRENLRTTLDSFLSDLLIREFLTGYKLTVTADRAMEIAGQVLVTMDLQPTFSIDVVRVIMNLS
jgi:hypothetical protein